MLGPGQEPSPSHLTSPYFCMLSSSPHSCTSQGSSPSQTLGLLISPYSDASPRGESQVAACERLAVLVDVVDVADGLSFLHSRRIMHHDVRPANVLLDADIFGVLVLELLTGRDPVLSVDGSQSHIREWVTHTFRIPILPLLRQQRLSSSDVSFIIDPRMPSPTASTDDVSMAHADVIQSLESLSLECTAMPAASRPSMAKVLSQR
ncbi:unnamed protein product [Closterium sp. NIES-64]|nr:unnamed protein product [Closterium sp. NIES-64]